MSKEDLRGEIVSPIENREAILEQILFEDPGKYSGATVERVKKFLEYENNNPEKKKPYRFLKAVEDYDLLYELHPKWQKKRPSEMRLDIDFGANSFVQYFLKCTKKEAKGDVIKRLKLIKRIFPEKRDWSTKNTIFEWKEEFKSHPEWADRKPGQMQKDLGLSKSFYRSLRTWIKNQSNGNKKIEEELLKEFFPNKRTSWGHLTTVEDWQREFRAHPNWGMENGNHVKLFGSLYRAFYSWVKRVAKDKREYFEYAEKVFPSRKKLWGHLTSLDDWIKEFSKHPEWQDRTRAEMDKDKESGACSFYTAFSVWTKKIAKNEEERETFMRLIFPPKRSGKMNKEVRIISPDEANKRLEEFFED